MYLGYKSSAYSAVRPHRRLGPVHASCFAALRGRGLERHDRRDEERPVAEGAATDRVEESGHRPTRHFFLLDALGFAEVDEGFGRAGPGSPILSAALPKISERSANAFFTYGSVASRIRCAASPNA